jgi:hypothetical protein
MYHFQNRLDKLAQAILDNFHHLSKLNLILPINLSEEVFPQRISEFIAEKSIYNESKIVWNDGISILKSGSNCIIEKENYKPLLR